MSASIHLESEHRDTELAEMVEDAVESRLVEDATTEQRSRRNLLLLDSFETVAEVFVQPSLDPDAKAAAVRLCVLVL